MPKIAPAASTIDSVCVIMKISPTAAISLPAIPIPCLCAPSAIRKPASTGVINHAPYSLTLMRVADHLENLARKDDNTKSGPVKVECEPEGRRL